MPRLELPLLVPAIRLDREDAAQAEATALRRAREPWTAGFILFGGEAGQVARLSERLRDAAGRPIFLSSDMERGAGQQVRGLTHLPDCGLVGLGGTPQDAHDLGEITARDARDVGVDVIFAPDVDVRSELENPILGNRSYGFDPGRVGLLATAMAAGILSGGALPVAKHFPGHGATRADSHDSIPLVEDDARVLRARDLEPFRQVIVRSACPGVMAAHIRYPALDSSGSIATFSRPITDLARSFLAPQAAGLLLFTDALLMAGAGVPGGEPEAARRALRGGCDMLLYPEDPERVAAEMLDRDGVPEADLARASHNLSVFLERRDEVARAAREPREGLREAPGKVAARALCLSGGTGSAKPAGAILVIDDDDDPIRGVTLRARSEQAGVPFELVSVPRGERPQLAPLPATAGRSSTRAIVVMAAARGWKRAPSVSEACRALVRETLDRLASSPEEQALYWLTPLPVEGRGTHLPGTGPHLEDALADALLAQSC